MHLWTASKVVVVCISMASANLTIKETSVLCQTDPALMYRSSQKQASSNHKQVFGGRRVTRSLLDNIISLNRMNLYPRMSLTKLNSTRTSWDFCGAYHFVIQFSLYPCSACQIWLPAAALSSSPKWNLACMAAASSTGQNSTLGSSLKITEGLEVVQWHRRKYSEPI